MDLVKFVEPSSSTQEDLPVNEPNRQIQLRAGSSIPISFTDLPIVVPDSFRRPRFRAVWRPMATDFIDCRINTTFRRRRSFVHDFPNRKQRMALRRRIQLEKQDRLPPYLPPPWVATFAEPSVSSAMESLKDIQKMITIKEESFLPKPSSRNNPIKKPKDLEDKVAALQLVVSRLHKLCLEKPEAVESTLPEETIQQFNNIHL